MRGKAPGVLKRIAGAFGGREKPAGISWEWDDGHYPRLLALDPRRLAGRSGIYLLWHLGVHPRWLRAGYANDLGAAATHLVNMPEIAAHSVHDGPFISWSYCAIQDAAGLVKFLASRLNPALQDKVFACDTPLDPAAAPLVCPLPSGTKDIQPH